MNDERGFTLLEVLVAFAILAVAMGAALQAFTGGIDAARRSEAQAAALAAARSLLDRTGTEIPLTLGKSDGESPGGGRWSTEISHRDSPLDTAGSSQGSLALFEVRVTVEVPGGGTVSLTTLKLGPAP